MPTYDYRCNACGHKFEEFQYFSEATLKKCPVCKKNKLQRLFGTGAGVIFKGTGFYETDYRTESYKQAAKADQGPANGASAKTEATDAGKTTGTPSTGKDTAAESKPKSTGKSPKSAT
jgi:putative FmdB family regulatory protein